jgi:hypothetical protein
MGDESFKEAMDGLSKAFEEVEQVWESDANEFWDSLTQDQKMLAFYSVVKRIHKGEIEEQHSYRSVLYGIFGFGPEAYAMGMMCGYLDIHNAIPLKGYSEKILPEDK